MLLTDFRKMIRQTLFCVGTDGNELCQGVFLEKSRGALVMTATDNRRLGLAKFDAGDGFPDFERIMVPTNVLRKIAKSKADTSTLSIYVSNNEACFDIGYARITAKPLAGRLGRFPKDQKEFHRIFPLSFTVDRLPLLEALRMVSAVIDLGLGHPVFLSLSSGTLALRTDHNDDCANAEIPCDYLGEKSEPVFNARYITEITEHIDADRLEIRFAGDHLNAAVLPVPRNGCFFLFARMRQY